MSTESGEEHVDLRPGDRVALLVPGTLGYVDLVMSLLAAGMYPVPLDPHLTPNERQRILATITPRLVVDSEALLSQMIENIPQRFHRGLPLTRPMFVTSGTTGQPKGVWTATQPRADAEQVVAEEQAIWGYRSDDVNLVLSPLHHSAPLRFAMGTLLAGGRVVVPGAFDPAEVTEVIERERPTSMFCVPAHLQRLFAYWDEHGVPDLGCFRLVAHAGAPCPQQLKHRLIETFPAGATWEFYGATEGRFTICASEEWLQRPGTVGRALPGRTMSADPDGMLWCEVPASARFEYFAAPEKTAAAWRGNAFTVGDLGRVDADGYVYLHGRREDLIISGGVNVYPAEVEAVLAGLAGVEEIAVYGVADERWGQRVCAAYVGTAEGAALTSYATEQLAPPKRPKEYHRLDVLPRTASGKIRRLDL